MCLTSAMTPLYIMEGFSKTGICPFSVEAPLNSELVIDPIEKIDPLPPKKKKRGHGISGKFLIEGKPLPTGISALPLQEFLPFLLYLKAMISSSTQKKLDLYN